MPRQVVVIATFFSCLTAAPGRVLAWNYTGHRVISSVAYRALDDATRKRVADALRKHPAYGGLWAKRATNGPDEDLNLFWNASVFPDDARQPPWDRYNAPRTHYVNFRILADRGNTVEPPVEGENVLNSYVAHLAGVRDPGTPPGDKALHLSWVFHQAEDIHQPLHSVARISKAFPEPEGDRGGNGVSLPNPRARGERGNNLHAYWDDLLGADDAPDAVARVADGLAAEYPRAAFAGELTRTDIRQWAAEGVPISLNTVYRNLDPAITRFADRPVGYDADATRAARRRAALAGYRLADELKRLFPAE
jgi:hypothetical protein